MGVCFTLEKRAFPIILSSTEHPISEDSLPLEVKWVLHRLRDNGFLAFVVGGAVRDLLLARTPKDFDLVTDATPSELQSLFYNCRIIGRRFRLAHIYFRDGHALEVSTFRADPTQKEQSHVFLRDDNLFGSPVEDAWRRDLTINALFYDSKTGNVIDYVGGLVDLKRRVVRTVGDPLVRFREDPVRMIRAIRHAVHHHLEMEPNTWAAIRQRANEIKLCPASRLQVEFFKDLRKGDIFHTIKMMFQSGLLEGWMPHLFRFLQQEKRISCPFPFGRFGSYVSAKWGTSSAIWGNLQVLDAMICNGLDVSELVALAALYAPIGWNDVFHKVKPNAKTHSLWKDAVTGAMKKVFSELPLYKVDMWNFAYLFDTYWKLHLLPQQPKLQAAIRASVYRKEAILLMKIELQSHLVPFPHWLIDLEEE